jgi:Zn finger protein HypA/HybF involved in hydrogenase expression
MKKCKYCEINDAIKYSKYSSGDFCSKKCANGFSTKEKRKEINEKVSKKLKGKSTGDLLSKDQRIENWKKFCYNKFKTDLLNANTATMCIDRLRKRICFEQDNKCNKCGLSEWLGKKLVLELEHKDGNHHNNKRENLEALCPNCHSLTSTWRGRNKKNNKFKITDEILLSAIVENNFNMRQALIQVGLAPKGGNYIRCYKLKKEYNEANIL